MQQWGIVPGTLWLQFNSVYLYSPISQITNLSRSALQSVHIEIPLQKDHSPP